MTYTTRDLVDDVMQGLIALVIIAGGGWAILSGSTHGVEILPLISVVVVYYFNKPLQTAAQKNGNGNGNGNGTPAAKPPTPPDKPPDKPAETPTP